MLNLYNLEHEKIKGLKAYKDYCIESVLKTGDKTLSFLCPKHLSKELQEEGYIRNKTDEFVIKEISNSGDYKSIKAVLNVEDLEGKEWEHFNTTEQTIEQCLNLALAGTGWTVQVNGITKKRTIRKTNCSTWDIIQQAKKTYLVEIEFDTINKIVKVAEKLGSDKGVYFMDSINLQNLNIQGNSYDFYTRLIAIGKDDLKVTIENHQYSKKKKTLIWKDERYTNEVSLTEDATAKLEEISKPYRAYSADIIDLANTSAKYKDILSYKLGDTITLISKEEGIREKQRIVSMKVWPDEPEKNSCEIANSILSFEDIQREQQEAVNTVNNITSDDGTISEGAIQGVVKKIVVDKADINSLNAVEIRVGEIEATKANITELRAANANIDKLSANKADILQLNAVSAKVNVLEADTASIKTLVAGNISAENIQTEFLQSLNAWMLEGSIGNAQISDLNANKLRSGTVDTSLVTVAGPQGRLKLQGNKLQVFDSKDNALYERIMLGIDENNNSALVLRGTDGKTVLLNQDGLTKAGFTDGYNKIDNNSLDGSKLDINSVVRKVNGATEKIESTVVNVGNKTLNVLLQEQNNSITEHGKNLDTQEARITANEKAINLKVDSQTYSQDKTTINKNIETTNSNLSKATSEISVLKGQIDLKVEQGDIDKTVTTVKNELDSKITDVITTTETKISNAKSEIKAETDKIKLSVSGLDSMTKAIETQLGDKATKSEVKVVSDRAASIEANLGGITQRVSSTESKISTVESAANNANDKIDNLQIGSANLLENTGREITSSSYSITTYGYTSPLVVGETYTATVCGELASDRTQFTLHTSGGYKLLASFTADELKKSPTKTVSKTFVYTGEVPGHEMTFATLYHMPSSATGSSTVKWVKLEKGNKATDWSPSPKDIQNELKRVEETTTNKFSQITSTMSDITQKVSSVEKTTSTLNGTVASQEARIKEAEQKITDSSIISTVKNAQTDGKATFATTSSVEQLSDQVNFKFNSVGSPNLLRNSYIENFDTSGWSISGLTKYFSNAPFFTPSQGWVAFDLTGGTYGADRGLFYQYLNGRYCPERNTDYTFSLSSITEGNIERFLIYIDYCKNGQYVYNQQFDLPIGYKQERHGILFTTPNGEFDEVRFYLDFRRKSGTSGYKVVSIGLPCLCRGSSTAYNNRANEVYTGNTRISAEGVTIYNGALTVVNKSGQNVISADSNGDITFKGKLQPNDYQVKLFGNNCQIDGSANAIRMQYDPTRYVAMDSAGYMRVFNQRSNNGTNYVSLGVNEEGHTILFCGRTMLKLLGGSQPGVQSRWGGDGGYCPMQASDFINNSTIKAKTNIGDLNIGNAIDIVRNNNIRTYQLKTDITNDGLDEKTTLWDSNAPIKTGLIIEELTPQAKDMLVPKDTDCISLYSMVSLLWGVVQEQQKQIETQQKSIDELKSLVIKD